MKAPISKRTSATVPSVSPEGIKTPTAKVPVAKNLDKEAYVKLCEQYKKASYAYYVESKPIMSDEPFDKVANGIKALLSLHPDLAKHGNPLSSIQSDHVDGFQKAQHSYPMLSLEDIYTEEELTKFVQNIQERTGSTEFSIECKLDGLSLSLIYEYGTLVRAVTRGDGTQGDDVTAQAYRVAGVLATVPFLKEMPKVEVRGEVVMPWAKFNKYNDACTNDKDKFANPRNAASGTLKSHDPNKCYERGLEFVAYYIDYCGYAKRNDFQNNRLVQLESYGFNTPRQYNGARYFDVTQKKNIMECVNELHNKEYPFPIDGIVIKAGYMEDWETLGYTDRFYKWGIAFKFKQESLQSRLLQVNWQVADSGRVTPVAIYEPIQMFGTTCHRATLNNPEWIEKHLPDLRIGDTLLLTKGGEIIPKVTGHIPHHRTLQEERMELITPRQWSEDLTVTPHTIAQTFGKVTPPECVNGKPTYRNGAYLQIDVEPKPKASVPSTPIPTASALVGSSLNGKTILVSGNFGTPQIRKDIERTVIEQGGTLAKGVTMSVDYYVLPDNVEEWKGKAGSKWQKIQTYMHQSRIITKDQFYSLIH